jgi:hypothetical protein
MELQDRTDAHSLSFSTMRARVAKVFTISIQKTSMDCNRPLGINQALSVKTAFSLKFDSTVSNSNLGFMHKDVTPAPLSSRKT